MKYKAFMLTKLHIIFQFALQYTESRASTALEKNHSIEPNSSNAARLHVAVCCLNHARRIDSKKQGNEQPAQGSRLQHNPSFEQNSGNHRRSKYKPRTNHQVHSISPETVKN